MNFEIMPILTIAALTGIIHTLVGPDHYLPFIALSKAQSWSRKRTFFVTLLCGLGHVVSAAVIAGVALGLRFSMNALALIESYRSDLAAWALIAIGCVYFVRSLKAIYSKNSEGKDFSPTPMFWSFFIIFVVGPCEPLFFLMTHPALTGNLMATVMVTSVFGLATLATMLVTVLGASYGLSFVNGQKAMRFAPAAAGLMIIACGVGIKFLGL